LRSIGAEVRALRTERRELDRLVKELESEADRSTSEGVESALTEAQFRQREVQWQLRRCEQETQALGLTVQSLNPFTVHIPGRTRSGELVFCWEEGERTIGHGHELGEENEPRRPLRIRS
jgi:hypothetical protein